MRKHLLWLPLAIAALVLGCGELKSPTPTGTELETTGRVRQADTSPQSNMEFVTPDPQTGVFEICKVGSAADFQVTITVNTEGQGPQVIQKLVHLEDGECAIVHTETDGPPADHVMITETDTDGFRLDEVVITNIDDVGGISVHTEPGPTIEGMIRLGKYGCVAVFHNSVEEQAPGRITGGGHQLRIDGCRITRGLTLHCDIALSNNLEINWPGGNKWHITRPLQTAECIDDPLYDPRPPAAPADTFIGEAIGMLNGVEGSVCQFKFIDDGEPGRTDQAHIKIWAPGADPNTDTPVLDVSGTLDGGNLQFHYDQPHGDNG